jgi:phosphatidate cytidylyltransferase
MQRVITAVVAALLAIAGVLGLDSRWVFWLALLLFCGAALEYVALGRRLFPGAPLWPLLLVLPLCAATWIVEPRHALLGLAAAPFLYAVVLLGRGDEPRVATGALGWLCFGTVYLSVPVWCIYELHRFDPELLLLLLVSVWLNDSAAFLVGSRWGRHKLAPRVSPNKSREGALAGLVAAGLTAWLGWYVVDVPVSAGLLVGLVVVAGAAAQAGDLVESLLKRAAGVKDSGSILPGHGGLLDRIDAIILAVPVFYALLAHFGPLS